MPSYYTTLSARLLLEPRKRISPKGLAPGPVGRDYDEGLVQIIDGEDHYNRLGDFVREAVLEKIDRRRMELPLGGPSLMR